MKNFTELTQSNGALDANAVDGFAFPGVPNHIQIDRGNTNPCDKRESHSTTLSVLAPDRPAVVRVMDTPSVRELRAGSSEAVMLPRVQEVSLHDDAAAYPFADPFDICFDEEEPRPSRWNRQLH